LYFFSVEKVGEITFVSGRDYGEGGNPHHNGLLLHIQPTMFLHALRCRYMPIEARPARYLSSHLAPANALRSARLRAHPMA